LLMGQGCRPRLVSVLKKGRNHKKPPATRDAKCLTPALETC
jgi:hypothetical protein